MKFIILRYEIFLMKKENIIKYNRKNHIDDLY